MLYELLRMKISYIGSLVILLIFFWIRSLLRFMKKHHIIIFLLLFSTTFFLGYWGYYLAFSSVQIDATVPDIVYVTLQLFKLLVSGRVPINNWQLQFARFFAPLLAFYAILSFLLIICHDSFTRFRLLFWNQHIIICGLGYLGPVIARNSLNRGEKVVIIEADQSNNEIETFRDLGAIVLTGDATQESMLIKANIGKSRDIFTVTGNDVKNLEIAIKAQSIGLDSAYPVCHIHLNDTTLCSVLKSQQFRIHKNQRKKLEFFNIYTIAGYCLQQAFPPFPEKSESVPDIHILVIGGGKMGKTLIVRTAKKWRDHYGKSGKKMLISLIDRHADSIAALIESQYPSIPDYCSILPYPIEFISPEFNRGSFLAGKEKIPAPTSVYITVEDTSMGLSLALKLQQRIRNPMVPVIVQTINVDGFTRMLDELRNSCDDLQNIHPFQIVSCDCCQDLIMNGFRGLIARAIHNNYLAKMRYSGEINRADPANRSWDTLDMELKASNYHQADFFYSQIQAIGCDIVPIDSWDEPLFTFSDDEIEFLARREHERWMQERILNGWRFGPAKDTTQKISPYLIPYHLLEDDIRDYDRNSIRAIPHILAKLDLKMVRGWAWCDHDKKEG